VSRVRWRFRRQRRLSRITGQSAYYLANELRDFASGVRSNAIMSPIATALSPEDLADVAAYYPVVDAPFLPLKAPDPALVKHGEALATVGSAKRKIHACNNCHGPAGSGEPRVIPYLAGQYSEYIVFSLDMVAARLSQEQSRGHGGNSKKLDAQEIAAVAAYYQQMRSRVEVAKAQRKE
jgi:cytochrome c553